MKVIAVTVNWNRAEDTLACIASLHAQRPVPPQVIVVDNGSSDDSVAQLRVATPEVMLMTNERNLGFSGGYNLGIRQALALGAAYVLIINNDAILAPDALATLLQHAAPGVGALAPLIYHAPPERVIWSLGGRTHPWTLEKSNPWVGQPDRGTLPHIIEQDFLTGCILLLPRATLETVGLFDEGFWLYYEDMDFARRVRLAGLRMLTVTEAHAWHKVASSSGGSDSPSERYWMARSSVRFFRKHGWGWRMLVILPYRLGSALKTSLQLGARGRFQALHAYWRGLRDGMREEMRP
ncbi:MAG: glycosyltransferase family 2 protein [Anaerolineales bacterium]